MKLKSMVKSDFVPMVKAPRFWISNGTLHYGSVFEVAPDIGHQLMSSYPDSFSVVSYEETAPKKRNKQVVADSLTQGSAAEFSIVEGTSE